MKEKIRAFNGKLIQILSPGANWYAWLPLKAFPLRKLSPERVQARICVNIYVYIHTYSPNPGSFFHATDPFFHVGMKKDPVSEL